MVPVTATAHLSNYRVNIAQYASFHKFLVNEHICINLFVHALKSFRTKTFRITNAIRKHLGGIE